MMENFFSRSCSSGFKPFGIIFVILFVVGCDLKTQSSVDAGFHPTVKISKLKSIVQASASQVVLGNTIEIRVYLRDEQNNPFVSENGVVSLVASGGTSVGTLGAVVNQGDGSYTASFVGVAAGTPLRIHGYLDGDLITENFAEIQVLIGVFSLSNSTLQLTANTISSGQAATATLTVRDASGAQVGSGGLNVQFSNSGGTSTGTFGAVVDNGDGTYSVQITGVGAGPATTIEASINGMAITSPLPTLQVVPGPASQIQVYANDNQSASVGTQLASSLSARVLDLNNNPVPSVGVDWTVASGGGSVFGCLGSVTDSSGLATCVPTLGTVAGSNSFTASTAGVIAFVTFSAIGVPLSNISSVTWGTAPSLSYTASSTIPMTLFTVLLKDAYGNVIATNNSTTVSLSITSGAGTLSGTTVSNVSVSSGVATFNDVHGTVAETITLRATENTSGNFVEQTGVVINHGPIHSISWTTAPVNTTAVSPQTVVVKGLDIFGNVTISDSISVVQLAAFSSSNCTGLEISNSLSSSSQNVASGVATFSNLEIRKVAVQSVLATLGSRTACVGNLTIANGPAYQVNVYSGDSQAGDNGTSLSNPLVAQVVDLHGNPVASVSVSWSVTGGNGSLSGCTTTSNASGLVQCQYTFGFGQPGVSSITATASGLSTPATFNATGNAVSFSSTWDFSNSGDYVLSQSSYSQIASGLVSLKEAQQSDIDNNAIGFFGGNSYGTVWDSTNSFLRLDQAGSATYLDEDSSWVPAYSSLIANLRMNGTAGSGIANDTVLTNSVGSVVATFKNSNSSTSPTTGFVTAKINQGITFDGNDDYISISSMPSLSYFTLAMWVKPSSFGGTTRCLANSSDTNGNLNFYISGSGGLYLYLMNTDGSRPQLSSSVTLVADQWAHIVLVNGASGKQLYVNGILAASDSKVSKPIVIDQLGKSGGANFMGVMDNVSIWDSALSATAVQALYQHTNTRYAGSFVSRVMDSYASGAVWSSLSWTTSLPYLKELANGGSSESSSVYSGVSNQLQNGLLGLWKLNENSGTSGAGSVLDSSGNNNHGTPTGSIGFAHNGIFNRSAYFGGSATFTVNGSASFPPAISTTGMSVSFWIRGSPGQNDKKVLMFGNTFASNPLYMLRTQCGTNYNTLDLYVRNPSGVVISGACTNTPVMDNTWHHVVLTDFNGTVKFYVDGKDTGSSLNYASVGDNYPKMHLASEAAGNGFFTGFMDEIAVWNRVLSSQEVTSIYRRGANRLRVQIRSCSDATCSSNPSWLGPDGTNQSYFSELYNTSSNALYGAVETAYPSMQFGNFGSLALSSNRYFQYRTILESDDSSTSCDYGSGATWCSPDIQTVTAGPSHYANSAPTVTVQSGPVFATLSSFSETLGGSGCASGVLYVLSNNNSDWYYWNGSVWALSDGTTTKASSAATISSHVATFSSQIGGGTLFVKAFLLSDGQNACSIDKIDVQGTK